MLACFAGGILVRYIACWHALLTAFLSDIFHVGMLCWRHSCQVYCKLACFAGGILVRYISCWHALLAAFLSGILHVGMLCWRHSCQVYCKLACFAGGILDFDFLIPKSLQPDVVDLL